LSTHEVLLVASIAKAGRGRDRPAGCVLELWIAWQVISSSVFNRNPLISICRNRQTGHRAQRYGAADSGRGAGGERCGHRVKMDVDGATAAKHLGHDS
jgi:hypothetical protein